jgi:hypothetical protein
VIFLKEPDYEKVVQGGEYQNFLLNKKLFIHFFFPFKTAFKRKQFFLLFFVGKLKSSLTEPRPSKNNIP